MQIINPNNDFSKFGPEWWDRFYNRAFHSFNADDQRKFSLIYPLIKDTDSVIDFGFGEGYFVSQLPDLMNRKIAGVEWSDVALKHGQERYPFVKFYKKDLEKPFLGNLKYDFGVCCEVLEHLKNPENLVKAIKRICKRAVITLPDENFVQSVVNSDKPLLSTEYASDELDYHYAAYTREDISKLFDGKVTFLDHPNHIVAYYEY